MAELHGNTDDFQEEDVWGMVKDSNSKPKARKNPPISSASSAWRPIPRSSSSSSAPVSIPDWSKIIKEKPKKNLWDDECDAEHVDDDGGHRKFRHGVVVDDDDKDDDMLPPHEFIARRLAGNTKIASFSMCEGVGRTLKGRDLSKLRNAILTKTGFLE